MEFTEFLNKVIELKKVTTELHEKIQDTKAKKEILTIDNKAKLVVLRDVIEDLYNCRFDIVRVLDVIMDEVYKYN